MDTHWQVINQYYDHPVPLTPTEFISWVKPSIFFRLRVFGLGLGGLTKKYWGNEFHPKIVHSKSNSSIKVFKMIMPGMKDNHCPRWPSYFFSIWSASMNIFDVQIGISANLPQFACIQLIRLQPLQNKRRLSIFLDYGSSQQRSIYCLWLLLH